jgi:hypothetical protein
MEDWSYSSVFDDHYAPQSLNAKILKILVFAAYLPSEPYSEAASVDHVRKSDELHELSREFSVRSKLLV